MIVEGSHCIAMPAAVGAMLLHSVVGVFQLSAVLLELALARSFVHCLLFGIEILQRLVAVLKFANVCPGTIAATYPSTRRAAKPAEAQPLMTDFLQSV